MAIDTKSVLVDLEGRPERRTGIGAPRRSSIEQILRAAEYSFSRNGFAGTTMAAIAEASGLPKSNLHYYFGSKELIYRAVLENILSVWLQACDVWLTKERTARDGLTGYICAKMEWSRARGDASRIFAGEMLAGGLNIKRFLAIEVRDYVERTEVVFRHWTSTGQLRSVSAPHLLFCIWAMTQSYADFSPQMEAVLAHPDGLTASDYSEGTKTILSLVLDGILVAGPPHG